MQLNSKKCQRFPAVIDSFTVDFFLGGFRKKKTSTTNSLILDFWPPEFMWCYIAVILSYLVCSDMLQQSWDTNNLGLLSVPSCPAKSICCSRGKDGNLLRPNIKSLDACSLRINWTSGFHSVWANKLRPMNSLSRINTCELSFLSQIAKRLLIKTLLRAEKIIFIFKGWLSWHFLYKAFPSLPSPKG